VGNYHPPTFLDYVGDMLARLFGTGKLIWNGLMLLIPDKGIAAYGYHYGLGH
jgi:hypothetical protein